MIKGSIQVKLLSHLATWDHRHTHKHLCCLRWRILLGKYSLKTLLYYPLRDSSIIAWAYSIEGYLVGFRKHPK